MRLLFLQLPVSAEDAEAALGREALAALETIGLAEIGERVAPRARILPIGRVLLASDGYSRDEDDPPDYVATYTPTARALDSLTPRPRVDKALDVGTGSGIHALLAAQHARQVIATDVNPRALAYTELNAALNGLRNIETRQGSLFEPVEGETFDLITCNAPYVVSPERRWVYRDSEFQDDQVSERVILLAAEHLNEGGYASMLVSWLAFDEKDPDERVRAWVEASGCDSWILPTLNSDPLTHAAEWNSHLSGAALAEALDEWAQYFDALGVQLVSEGAVVLHKQGAGAQRTIRIDELDEDDLDDAGDQILRAFEARAKLAAIGSDNALLEARVGVASGLRLVRELEPSGGRAVDVEGTRRADRRDEPRRRRDRGRAGGHRLPRQPHAVRRGPGHDLRPARPAGRRGADPPRGGARGRSGAARARRPTVPRRLTARRRRLYEERSHDRPGGHDERRLEAQEAGEESSPEVAEGEAPGQARRVEEGLRRDLM